VKAASLHAMRSEMCFSACPSPIQHKLSGTGPVKLGILIDARALHEVAIAVLYHHDFMEQENLFVNRTQLRIARQGLKPIDSLLDRSVAQPSLRGTLAIECGAPSLG